MPTTLKNEAVIVGIGQTKYTKNSGVSELALASEAVRNAITDAGIRGEVAVYVDADHGFHCDQRDSYNAAAAQDAWQRVTALFASELKG